MSQSIAAFGGGEIRPEHPLVLRLRNVDGAELDLVQTQLEARANFLQLNVFPLLFVDVMSGKDERVGWQVYG